jgi:hypothetical protein
MERGKKSILTSQAIRNNPSDLYLGALKLAKTLARAAEAFNR